MRVALGLLALIVLLAAAGYGYFRYEFERIQTAACASCVSVADGAPYNVLVIGSDTRSGETAAEAEQFGKPTNAGGQRSDTIKVIHVDPKAGTASVLSLPRDTLVTLSGVPASSGVSNPNKLNAAFAAGPNDKDPSGTGANGLVQTIQNTFGIPISHWIVVNFFGLMDAVNALGGVSMDVPYPVQRLRRVRSGRLVHQLQRTRCHHHRMPGPLRLSVARPLPLAPTSSTTKTGSGTATGPGTWPDRATEPDDRGRGEQGQIDLQPHYGGHVHRFADP